MIREEDKRGRLEYERIMRGEDVAQEGAQARAEAEQAARGSGGSTPRFPSLQPRRPSLSQAAKSASPRKTPRADIFSTQEMAVALDGVGDGGSGSVEDRAGATAQAPTEGLPVDAADTAPDVGPMRVLIEDCEATPRAFEIRAGTALSFVVDEDEPEHFEYGFEVRRVSAGVDAATTAEDVEEGAAELLSKSPTITAGETWVCPFDEPGVYFLTDPDFSPDCDVRVVVLQAAGEEPPGGSVEKTRSC